MRSKTLLLDVTTLLKWKRPPVGIIRTQLEFVSYIIHNDETARYCYFTQTRDDIKEMSKDDVIAIIEKLSQPSQAKQCTQEIDSIKIAILPSRYTQIFKKTWYAYKNEGLKSVLIKICKKICPLKLKSLAKKVYIRFFSVVNSEHSIQDVCGKYFFAPEIHQAKNATYPFLTDKTIMISIGLDWDNSNYSMLYWLKKKIGFSFVGAFYDAIPITHPELVQSSYFSQKFFAHFYSHIHLADKIFCISEYSKSQLIELCEMHSIEHMPQLQTIYLGDALVLSPKCSTHSKRKHTKNYILYVSTIEARKNHKLLLDIWEKLAQDTTIELPDLVFVGMIGWGVEMLQEHYAKNSILQKVVHFYHDVDDEELATLYQGAMFTVFPSFIEGWGLGAVESMLYGKVCVISDCPALREATQGLMPSCDPKNADIWIYTIKQLLLDKPYKEELEQRIREKFKSRSWEDFAIDFKQFASASL